MNSQVSETGSTPSSHRQCRCGRPLTADRHLCKHCQHLLWTAVGNVPALVAELEVAMSKQMKFTETTSTSKSSTQGLPYDQASGQALRGIQAALVFLVGRCLTARLTPTIDSSPPVPADQRPDTLSRWLLCRLSGLTRTPWAPEAWQLVTAVERGMHVIDRPPDKTYAGPCDECGTDLYAPHNATQVTCHECGQRYDTQARREWLLGLVHDRLATSSEIAQALTSLALPVTPERIRQWKRRDRLTPKGMTPNKRPLYRVGDVMELLLGDTIKAAS